MVDTSEKLDLLTDLPTVQTTILRAQEYLLGVQYEQGYWWGELESNATMEAEFILMNQFLGISDPPRWKKLANLILSKQRDDGTLGQFYGAPGDLSTTTECSFALKPTGISPD